MRTRRTPKNNRKTKKNAQKLRNSTKNIHKHTDMSAQKHGDTHTDRPETHTHTK